MRKSIRSRSLLTLILFSAMLRGQTPDRVHQREILAATGPVTVKGEVITVTLKPVGEPVTRRLQSLKRDQQIVLVIRGIVIKQPADVLYQVLLDLREGAVPSPGATGFAGTLDLFEADPSGKGDHDRRTRRYPVSEILGRLQYRHQLMEPITVTIAPLGKPADNADVSIERIELVLETEMPK